MSRKLLVPKKPAWAIGTAILIGVSLLCAFVSSFFRPLDPGRGICLWMGIVASVLFVGLALYPARRKALARPFGNAQTWIQLHVWGGLLAAILVLVHQAFRLPGGTMGWLLFLLTLLSVRADHPGSVKRFYTRFWVFFFAEYLLFLLAYGIPH